ncbi:MAG: efflux RND transporter periplasmic adaptor subunit [Acidobacteria bacterium]|nr:MAG: efflux RND transporter periplasmic adaptor subunit [Acidobacteriota bacterium]
MRYVTILLLALALIAGCRRTDQVPASAEPPQSEKAAAAQKPEAGVIRIEPEMMRDLRVTTARAESRQGGEIARLLGEIRVNENAYAEVGAPVVARVLSFRAAPGDAVQRGQPLAQLQSTELGRARADFQSARAKLDLSHQALSRKQDLAKENIVPLREVQEAEAAVTAAEAEVRAARAALATLGAPADGEASADAGSELVLRSPIAGTVIERRAAQGQMAEPSAPLFRIANLDTLWLTVHAFERDAVRIRPGTEAQVSFAAMPGRPFAGRVSYIGSEVNAESRTVSVRIEIANQDRVLRPGMSATAAIPVGETGQPLVTVPAAALQRLENEWVVFVPKDASTFEIRRIGRGRDLGGEVEMLSGLKAGETIVVDGSFLLKSEADKARGAGAHEGHEGK